MDARITQEYHKQLNLEGLDPALGKFLKRKLPNDTSSRNRLGWNWQRLKYNFEAARADTSMAIFKVVADGTSCIYAHMHACHPRYISSDPVDEKYNGILPARFSLGPAFRSQDGEYRSRVILASQYHEIWSQLAVDPKYSHIFEHIESMVLQDIESGRMHLHVEFAFAPLVDNKPLSDAQKRAFHELIDNGRYAVQLYALCWLQDYYRIRYQYAENHIDPAYQLIIYNDGEDDAFLDDMVESIGHDGYRDIIARTMYDIADVTASRVGSSVLVELRVGQKIFALTEGETTFEGDLNFAVWREIYISVAASNLVLNLVSPSFPAIASWFYIDDCRAELFDNLAMRERYERSDIAAASRDNFNTAEQLTKRDGKSISGRFAAMGKIARCGANYASNYLVMSRRGLCVLGENLGYTLRDLPAMIASGKTPHLEGILSDTALFQKHMFEYLYAFHCLHTKLGVVHGDPHANNLTIYTLYNWGASERIAYIIGDACYILPHNQCYSGIIDFSRAIIGKHRLVADFGEEYAERFVAQQLKRALVLLRRHFPELLDKREKELEAKLAGFGARAFSALSAIDAHLFCANFEAMFRADPALKAGKVALAPGVLPFLRMLLKQSTELAEQSLRALLDGGEVVAEPCMLLIKRNFQHLLFGAKSETNDEQSNGKSSVKSPEAGPPIADIFHYDNILRYDISGYDTWGPLLVSDAWKQPGPHAELYQKAMRRISEQKVVPQPKFDSAADCDY
jgi:hypothetical protein